MEMRQGKVLGVAPLTPRISAMRIGAADGDTLPGYAAGSHLQFAVPGGTRAYSLVAFAPVPENPAEYLITVQREDAGAGGSKAMHALQAGDAVSFSVPSNDFPLDPNAPALLLAGGIGITPLISMAASAQNARMVYAGRARSEMAYLGELTEMLGDALTLHYDDQHGQLDIPALIDTLGDAHLYVCGPRGMIDAARAAAEAAGVAPERIHFELFEAAAVEEGDSAFEVEINDGTVFTIPPGKTIIEVLEENDVDVMYDCQRGDCGICQCDVLEGEPDHRDVVLSEAERAAGDVMQICVSRAKSPRLVLDVDA